MLEIEKRVSTVKKVTAKICDKCGRKATDDDIIEFQEFYRILFQGGYGSIFGDEQVVSADLCQHCLKKIIGDFCVYVKEAHE